MNRFPDFPVLSRIAAVTRFGESNRARRRDRQVYLRSHPVLFALLALGRKAPVRRLGRTVIVHGAQAYREVLTKLPLDRAAPGTTGGAASELASGGVLFDQDGSIHRGTRRTLADDLGAAGVERLRPVWNAVLERRCEPLARGHSVDVTQITAELAGATINAMLDLEVDPPMLADLAREVAAATVNDHLPGPRRRPRTQQEENRPAGRAAARLTELLGVTEVAPPALAAMLAVAAVNTTVAGLPRAVAWCADADLWDAAIDEGQRPALVNELLRVVAPSPLLPRVAARDGQVAGCPIRAGQRLMLITRHAVGAHQTDPDWARPAPVQVAQMVFGAGPHACPGARLARAQTSDTLRALAPYRPVVVTARVDRGAALPGWASLVVRPTQKPRPEKPRVKRPTQK